MENFKSSHCGRPIKGKLPMLAGAKRVAGATAYTDMVNATLERFLKESGFEVLTIKGLNLIRATNAVTQQELYN